MVYRSTAELLDDEEGLVRFEITRDYADDYISITVRDVDAEVQVYFALEIFRHMVAQINAAQKPPRFHFGLNPAANPPHEGTS